MLNYLINLLVHFKKKNIMNSFEKLKELVAATERDANAFYGKGNKAVGTCLRKAYMEIKSVTSAGRNEVTELKNKQSK